MSEVKKPQIVLLGSDQQALALRRTLDEVRIASYVLERLQQIEESPDDNTETQKAYSVDCKKNLKINFSQMVFDEYSNHLQLFNSKGLDCFQIIKVTLSSLGFTVEEVDDKGNLVWEITNTKN